MTPSTWARSDEDGAATNRMLGRREWERLIAASNKLIRESEVLLTRHAVRMREQDERTP